MSDGEGRAGTTLADRYRVSERLGTLLQANLYRAEDLTGEKPVTLLVLERPHVPTVEIGDAIVAELTEAAGGPHHPALVEILDSGRLEDGTVYAAAPVIDGRPAAALIEEAGAAPIEVERLKAILGGLLDGLGALHDIGRVHGAVGPDLVFAGEGGARLFPVSFRSLRESDAPTAPGLVMAAPEYMAPEQLTGGAVDERTDLYQLGCLIYALVAGRPPFQGDSPVAIMTQHLTGEIPPLPEGGESRGELDRVIARLLEKTPADRYASAAEVRAAMPESGAATTAPVAAEAPVVQSTDGPAPRPSIPDEPRPAPGTPLNGGAGRVWLAIAVLLLVAGLLAIWFAR